LDLRIQITRLVSSNFSYGFWLAIGIFKLTFLPLLEGVMVMVFNATFNNISAIWWQLVLLAEETGIPGKKHYYKILPQGSNVDQLFQHLAKTKIEVFLEKVVF
jgi:hypothetical protein